MMMTSSLANIVDATVTGENNSKILLRRQFDDVICMYYVRIGIYFLYNTSTDVCRISTQNKEIDYFCSKCLRVASEW